MHLLNISVLLSRDSVLLCRTICWNHQKPAYIYFPTAKDKEERLKRCFNHAVSVYFNTVVLNLFFCLNIKPWTCYAQVGLGREESTFVKSPPNTAEHNLIHSQYSNYILFFFSFFFALSLSLLDQSSRLGKHQYLEELGSISLRWTQGFPLASDRINNHCSVSSTLLWTCFVCRT